MFYFRESLELSEITLPSNDGSPWHNAESTFTKQTQINRGKAVNSSGYLGTTQNHTQNIVSKAKQHALS